MRALLRFVAAAGGLAILWGVASVDLLEARRAPVARPVPATTVESGTRLAALVSPDPPVFDVKPLPPSGTSTPAGTSRDDHQNERVTAAIHALAEGLRATGFDDALWSTRVSAVASTLGPASTPKVRIVVSEAVETDVVIAGASLLLQLQAHGEHVLAPLDGRGLETLVRVSHTPASDPLGARLAARALAALGGRTWSDRLLAKASRHNPETDRRWALAALQASNDALAALELAAGLARGEQDPLEPTVLATLERMARESSWAFASYERAQVVDLLLRDRTTYDPASGLDGVLHAWDPKHASDLLASLGIEPTPALWLASVHDPVQIESVLVRLRGRTDVVDWIGRVPDPDSLSPALRAGLVDELVRCTADESEAVRRRAVAGLGHLNDPSAAPHVAQVLRLDADAAVRNAAARALQRLDPRHPTLAGAREADPSQAVRRSAGAEGF